VGRRLRFRGTGQGEHGVNVMITLLNDFDRVFGKKRGDFIEISNAMIIWCINCFVFSQNCHFCHWS
jgi:hypothetical protein